MGVAELNQSEWRFEFEPYPDTPDETSYSLRAYLDRMSEEKLASYHPGMSDEELMSWDGNFKNDGGLFLVCCDRDVETAEFRREVEACIAYRARLRS